MPAGWPLTDRSPYCAAWPNETNRLTTNPVSGIVLERNTAGFLHRACRKEPHTHAAPTRRPHFYQAACGTQPDAAFQAIARIIKRLAQAW